MANLRRMQIARSYERMASQRRCSSIKTDKIESSASESLTQSRNTPTQKPIKEVKPQP